MLLLLILKNLLVKYHLKVLKIFLYQKKQWLYTKKFKYPNAAKEFIFFHEMGHCNLNIFKHGDEMQVAYIKAKNGSTIKQNVSMSIMNSTINPIDVVFYKKYRKLYLTELFYGIPMKLTKEQRTLDYKLNFIN